MGRPFRIGRPTRRATHTPPEDKHPAHVYSYPLHHTNTLPKRKQEPSSSSFPSSSGVLSLHSTATCIPHFYPRATKGPSGSFDLAHPGVSPPGCSCSKKDHEALQKKYNYVPKAGDHIEYNYGKTADEFGCLGTTKPCHWEVHPNNAGRLEDYEAWRLKVPRISTFCKNASLIRKTFGSMHCCSREGFIARFTDYTRRQLNLDPRRGGYLLRVLLLFLPLLSAPWYGIFRLVADGARHTRRVTTMLSRMCF